LSIFINLIKNTLFLIIFYLFKIYGFLINFLSNFQFIYEKNVKNQNIISSLKCESIHIYLIYLIKIKHLLTIIIQISTYINIQIYIFILIRNIKIQHLKLFVKYNKNKY
jgi:hypothetical protein